MTIEFTTYSNSLLCFSTLLVKILPLEYGLKGEGLKLVSIPFIELVLELHPVQPEGVQEGRQTLHHQQDTNSQNCVCYTEKSNYVYLLVTTGLP